MSDDKKAFWETLPGLLTGIAAVITALTGLIAIFVHSNSRSSLADRAEARDERPGERSMASAPAYPKHRDTPRVADVSGSWRDLILGTQVRIQQKGNLLTTETMNPLTGQHLASGTGVISGRKIEGPYQWVDGSRYVASLDLSEDGTRITGSYRNTYTGQSGAVSLTRQ